MRVLSQSEIDAMLASLLADATILPDYAPASSETPKESAATSGGESK